MKTIFFCVLTACICFSPFVLQGSSEEIIAVEDSLCIQSGEEFHYNVVDNDVSLIGFFPPVFLITPSSCFELFENGELRWKQGDEPCCGEHRLLYQYEFSNQICIGEITITVKCPKPECFLLNLEDISGESDPVGGGMNSSCIYACENSTATYFLSYNPLNTYLWNVAGGSFVAGVNSAEIVVTWGSTGSGFISVIIIDTNNQSQTLQVCVEILPGPVADFDKSSDCVCLNGIITFINNSTGGTSYFWDFGDGNSSSSFAPSHQYVSPGTYTVTLYATNNNFDSMGNPLCCCTDSMSMEVVVDSLIGPNIYWVSTLCAGDSTKYWTDASNCSNYVWTVLDETNTAISFVGQGNDTICVNWGAGPIGTVMLEVKNCDSAYCEKPTSVVVPIISSTIQIIGSQEVCENGTGVYSVPKWLSTLYDWQVTGGIILSGQGSNTVVVQWGLAPGPGLIMVDYCSEFLAGLPMHDPPDCKGSGNLSVAIKPEFEIFGPIPNSVCENSSSVFFASSSPYANYNWTITPPVTFSGQGTNNISVTWDGGTGIFTIIATPNDTTVYCNKLDQYVVNVTSIPPPDAFDGPLDICPGGSGLYFGVTNTSGIGFNWLVTGGTPAFFTGNPLSVTWNPSGPYSISLQQFQLNAPYCLSNPISINLSPKSINGPLNISGPDACTNEIQSYSSTPSQHPDANYNWYISPVAAGSIFAGQNTPAVQIQWNNDPGPVVISMDVELCGIITSVNFTVQLNAALVPTITQVGMLCPGGSVTLDAGSGFINYAWSTFASTQTINISSAGIYVVTTTDFNMCTAVDAITVIEEGGPVASISTPDPTVFCIVPPNSNAATLSALTNTSYSYMWFCNGILQTLPSTQAFLVHTNTNVVANFNYWVVVTDSNGCMNTSNTITVIQTDNCDPGGGGGCVPENYTLNINALNQNPNCNIVDFAVTASGNVTPVSWNFGDPANNVNTGTLINAIHAYSMAGYYTATFSATVAELPPGTGTCTVLASESVCVPLAANFNFTDSCLTVKFTDQSTFLPGHDITNWVWDFDDGNNSIMQCPVHTYLNPGSYNVMLTVSNVSGCQAKITLPVVISGVANPVLAAAPMPACVGDPINFTGTGTGVVSWLWDFDDGATNGSQNPIHTFGSAGTFTVLLTILNEAGCESVDSIDVTIFPNPPNDTISFSPSLTVCAGDTIILTAPSGAGYSYSWSTNETTQTIKVANPGCYSVIVSDVNLCKMIPDSVCVDFFPAPDAIISGNLIICDMGCTVLSTPAGFGYSYQWYDQFNLPITGQIFQSLTVCTPAILPSYYVEVTDINGCKSTSTPVSISIAVSPNFVVLVSPDSCEITPSTLAISPVQADVVYSWSTGMSGSSIIVSQAGTYTVIGVDTLTGCSHSEIATIYPIPDLCLVPSGCYEVCDPDTICGPSGLTMYQWNMNGFPISGETDSCLIVTQTGSYSLTGTNMYGCQTTSDTLILTVIPCDTIVCDSLMIMADILDNSQDTCCFSFSYKQNGGDLLGLMISSADTDFDIDLSSIHSSLGVQTIGSNWLGLVNSSSGSSLPAGMLSDFIHICFKNITQSPQKIIFDWYNFDFEIVCSDTLLFECPVEPDCLYMLEDSIYCQNGQIVYDFKVCNPIDGNFDIGYIIMNAISPIGIILSQTIFDDTSNPILPGECRNYSILLSGPNIENQLFCYSLLAHQFNPEIADTSLCCSLDTSYCILIPDCDPCDDVGIESVLFSENIDNGGCCFELSLYNNFAPDYFTGVGLCLLGSGSQMTINNPFGSGWTTFWYSPDSIVLNVSPPVGANIPLGTLLLPKVCVKTTVAPPQILEIKWMVGDSIVCRDTLELNCEPDCGYIFEENILCLNPVTWDYQFFIKNTSSYTMSEAHIAFTSPAGLNIFDQDISLGALTPGNIAGPFSIVMGSPAMAGDTVCFTVALHEIGHDDLHTNCCNFHHCFVLPPCVQEVECLCNDNFFAEVQQGISCQLDPSTNTGLFWPAGILTDCDEVFWEWNDSSPLDQTIGNATINHTFTTADQFHQVCIYVIRLDDNGKLCESKLCKKFEFFMKEETDVLLFPNPATGKVWIRIENQKEKFTKIGLYDNQYQIVFKKEFELQLDSNSHLLNIEDLIPGIYLLRINNGDNVWLKKLVIK